MTFPDLGWKELVISIAAAFIGWLAKALDLWRLPPRKE